MKIRNLLGVWVIAACASVASCERAHSDAMTGVQASARGFRVWVGAAELRGSLVPIDQRDADLEVVLDVRNAVRKLEAQYRYRLHVALASGEPVELCVRERHMYALLPRDGVTWSKVLESGELERAIEVVRLDGAGEEN